MRTFTLQAEAEGLLNSEIVGMLTAIHEEKGRQAEADIGHDRPEGASGAKTDIGGDLHCRCPGYDLADRHPLFKRTFA